MDYIWNVTGRCNLNCKYCWDIFKQEKEMDTRKAKEMIDRISSDKCEMLLFTGGEPLVRNDLFELISYADSKKISNIKICTNGVLIDKYIQKIVTSAITEIHISLDSLVENDKQYRGYRIEKILQNSKPKKDDEHIFMIRDITERQFKRQAEPSVIPCPFRQLNDITNAGGYPEHSVNVILDKPKAKKTFFMVNLARGYLRMKKSVLYVDTENGKEQIMDRFIQSSINKTKKELYSGEYDKLEAKHLRKLARFGVELVVERVPAMITDCNYIRELIIKLRNQGINIKVLMVDYAGKLASIARDKEDFDRISNVYIDIQNLAEEMDLDIVWTAHHITREGKKHRTTRYDENDISGSIAIVRNAHTIVGLNSTEQEEKDDILRCELVEQRKQYDEIYGEKLEESLKKKGNPDANEEKRAKTSGDI